jgi:hypothetical protein
MHPRTCILSAFTLSTAMFFGVAAMAADLPKEGTYSGTYSSVGTVKATAVGKERMLIAFDEYGLSLGKGITDRMRWHCSGLIDLMSGIGQIHGHCAAADPDGDQIAVNFDGDKFSPAAKTNSVMVKLTTGTGKYTGISGGHTFIPHSDVFQSAEGPSVNYGTFEGSYKLP